VFVPLGVYALRYADPATLRHVTSLVILGIAGCMAAGARYAGTPSRTASAGVGALSGLMSGAIGLSGPPIVLFWLGGQADARTARANMIAYFGLSTVVVVSVMLWSGLLTWVVLRLSVVLIPIYAVGVLLGARGFRLVPERLFRVFALVLIAAVAIGSLFR
jgi:hypothetical protein